MRSFPLLYVMYLTVYMQVRSTTSVTPCAELLVCAELPVEPPPQLLLNGEVRTCLSMSIKQIIKQN